MDTSSGGAPAVGGSGRGEGGGAGTAGAAIARHHKLPTGFSALRSRGVYRGLLPSAATRGVFLTAMWVAAAVAGVPTVASHPTLWVLAAAPAALAVVAAAVVWHQPLWFRPAVVYLSFAAWAVAVAAAAATAPSAAASVAVAALLAWDAVCVASLLPPLLAATQGVFAAAVVSAGLTAGGVSLVVTATVVVAAAGVGLACGYFASMWRAQALTDELTGLPNRAAFSLLVVPEFADVPRGRPLSVALVDLDGFKSVNDTFGHRAGDRFLAEAASAWKRSLRAGDVLARYGGDEFVVVLRGCPLSQATAVLDRMRTAAAVPCSVGVTEVVVGDTEEDVCRRADAALYVAKRAGGGRVVAAPATS